MTPQLLERTLTSLIRANQNTHIEGEPGLGKTAIPKQVAASMGLMLIHQHCATKLQEDYGMPVIDKASHTHSFTAPADLPIVGSDYPDEGVILLDELPQSGFSEQKIFANMLSARELHGHHIKPGWRFISTGNRASDRAGANRLLTHVRDRVVTLKLDANMDDWVEWAIDNEVADEVISFIRFRPGLLIDFDAGRERNATPRGWAERVSPMIGNIPPEAELEAFGGAVGEGAAAEFVGFLRICRSLPDPDALLMNPNKGEVPSDPATLYALSGAIAARASENNFDSVVTYAKRMPPEYSVLVMRDSTKRNKDVTKTKAYRDWCAKEGKNILR
jgi:hypothetical protein